MNKKTGLVFLTLIFVLLISGCESQETTTSDAFIGGTEGLKAAFLEGAPPPVVYDNGNMPFAVNVMVENLGEHDLTANQARVTIVGVDPSDFNNANNVLTISDSIDGMSFGPEHNVVPGNVSGDVNYPFRAEICYQYGTKAQGFLCVKDDLTDSDSTNGDSVCLANEAKMIENSGAPVHVLNLAESAAGSDTISFTFDISHRGSGLVSKMGSWCDDSIGNKSIVNIIVNTGISEQLDCTQLTGTSNGYASGSVQLFSGKRTIRCTQSLGLITSDYEKILNVDLSYDYKKHTSTDVTVRHSG